MKMFRLKWGINKFGKEQNKKLLGMKIRRNLNFDDHMILQCKKVGRKLAVLARLSKLISFKQKRIVTKTLVESAFGYCPLTWSFHSRKVNGKIIYKNNL